MIIWLFQLGTYRWGKVLETLSGNQGEMHAAEEPGEWIFDCFSDTVPCTDDIFVLAAVRDENTILSNFSLLLREPCRVVLD